MQCHDLATLAGKQATMRGSEIWWTRLIKIISQEMHCEIGASQNCKYRNVGAGKRIIRHRTLTRKWLLPTVPCGWIWIFCPKLALYQTSELYDTIQGKKKVHRRELLLRFHVSSDLGFDLICPISIARFMANRLSMPRRKKSLVFL